MKYINKTDFDSSRCNKPYHGVGTCAQEDIAKVLTEENDDTTDTPDRDMEELRSSCKYCILSNKNSPDLKFLLFFYKILKKFFQLSSER